MKGPHLAFLLCVFVAYPNNILHTRKMFFFQAEDGIRDCLLSRGLGDVYKRQIIVACEARLKENGIPLERNPCVASVIC